MHEYVSKELLYEMCQPSGVFRLHVSHIDQMKPADVAPVVHAKFVYGPSGVVCSECRKKPMMQTDNEGYFLINPKYCPHCGARFDLKTFG